MLEKLPLVKDGIMRNVSAKNGLGGDTELRNFGDVRSRFGNLLGGAMSKTALDIRRHQFVTTCRALNAAANESSKLTITLRFEPRRLTIESDYGGGIIETNGTFISEVRVTYGILSKIASLDRKDEDCGPFIKCILDEELREIQFPREGLRAKFVA